MFEGNISILEYPETYVKPGIGLSSLLDLAIAIEHIVSYGSYHYYLFVSMVATGDGTTYSGVYVSVTTLATAL